MILESLGCLRNLSDAKRQELLRDKSCAYANNLYFVNTYGLT